MRETPFSNCERDFILEAISQKKRLDGRGSYDFRRMCITFGVDRGCCQVELGQTRVLAQVSCEVTEPGTTRPTDGILRVNVELSPMAAPNFEAGRQSEYGVELNRLLERCIRESRCVDTESLCIMAGVKVWLVRLDVHVLNNDGNLVDCASIAAISALTHFRRPDVSVTGEDFTIHTVEERDPVPLSIHHMPICVTFAFFEKGKYVLVDPQLNEERVMEGRMVVGMNKHREICTFQMTGSMLLLKDQVLRCSNIAVVKVTETTELIQKALENDAKARAAGDKFGFAASVVTAKATALEAGPGEADMEDVEEDLKEITEAADKEEKAEEKEETSVTVLGRGTAQIGEGGHSTWDIDEQEMEEILSEQREYKASKQSANPQKKLQKTSGDVGDDSEEEDTVQLKPEDLHATESSQTDSLAAGQIDLSMALKKSKGKKTKKRGVTEAKHVKPK